MNHYSFSDLLEPLLLPPGINIFLILIGMVIIIFFRLIGKTIMAIGFISLWLLSTPIIAYKLLDSLQNQYPMLNVSSLTPSNSPDVIIVLGGGEIIQKEYGNRRSVSDFTLHRVDYAAYLHQQMQLPILVSGGGNTALSSEASLMSDVLKNNFNITPAFIEDKSLTTADESIFIDPILKENKLDKAYLVTDAWHMPRSMYIFNCKGINVTAAPMGYISYGPGYSLLSFLPNIESLRASSIAFHEYVGLLWYHLRYQKTCVKA